MMEERSEIAFFDLETTIPTRRGQGFAILEFGAILVCPRKLEELRSYSTLVRPTDLSHISNLSVRCNGITKDAVVSAPTFAEVADIVYDLLHGRIWAGHNILRFDCARIREAFADINRPAPEPKGTIDSLALLTQKFGRRAGDMKMASLATYFGLGKQSHRSLDDVRMNLEVLKYCATVLFVESSLPDIFTENSWVSPNAITRSRTNGKTPMDQTGTDESMKLDRLPELLQSQTEVLMTTPIKEGNPSLSGPDPTSVDPFDWGMMRTRMDEPLPVDSMEEEKDGQVSPESSSSEGDGCSSSCDDFLAPDDVSIPSISATLAPFYRGTQRIHILHQNLPLQLRCACLKVRFGISTKFVDHAGRPRLNLVVEASPNLCNILDEADRLAQKLSADSSSSSEWHHAVARKPGFFNSPTVRLHIPTVAEGEITRWTTEIHQKDSSGTQKLMFSRFEITELESLFTTGTIIDAYFSLDAYDFLQNAGIRLVANKLVVHSS